MNLMRGARHVKPGSGFIFDCDGTLADSMPIHHEAWSRALQQHGASFEFTWELFLKRAGMSLERTVEELNQEFFVALDPVSVARMQRAEYDKRLGSVRAIPEVVEFARDVAERHPVAVASGSELSVVERTLGAIGARDLFSIVVTAADVARGKPDPDLFLLAAARMNVPASECVVFEDSALGLRAAERAGMKWVLVRPGPGARIDW